MSECRVPHSQLDMLSLPTTYTPKQIRQTAVADSRSCLQAPAPGACSMSLGLTDYALHARNAVNLTDQQVFHWGILEPHNGSPINWAYLFFLFKNISPYFWCTIGIGQCVGLSILGASWWDL